MQAVDRHNRIKRLFSDALDLEPAARDSFLDSATTDDVSIRIEVCRLIAAHDRASGFIVDPTVDAFGGAGATHQTIGRYELVRLIGEGGFGSVYLARQDEPISREVALKVIKPGMDTVQVIARFEAERQALAMMKHPGIAAVFDAGATPEGRPYFVMEFVDGVAITDYCDQHRLSIEQRLKLFIEVCNAVQHAHSKGVVHRDLKPGNLLVARHGDRDDTPLPKVIDFGIAKATNGRSNDLVGHADRRTLAGTPQYMSPEQVEGNVADIDTRTDVYSLGVVLYELLAGVAPLDEQRLRSADNGDWQRMVREEAPPSPSARLLSTGAIAGIAERRNTQPRRLVARLSGDLDRITLKAIKKDRDQRYLSPSDLAEDLERHLNHEPVLAAPQSAAYRMRKFVRRHRVGVLSSCFVALALIAGAVGLAVGMVEARASAERARDAAEQAQAVNDFMGQILTSVKPELDGADVRLFEVMDTASSTASRRFANHPLQEAQVRDLLGGVFADLTMYGKAKAEFRRAMELWKAHVGLEDRRTLASERQYVGSAINNQQLAEVESRLPSLLERTSRVFGANHLATLAVQRAIGVAHMQRGRWDEAERVLLDVRERQTAHGDDDEQQVFTLRNLIRLGRMRASEANTEVRTATAIQLESLAREMVERAVRVYGPASLIALEARIGWANMLADQRRYSDAARECREILKVASDRLGECHRIRIESLNVLAKAALFQGDSVTAAELKLKQIDCARQTGSAMSLAVEISDTLPLLDRGKRWAEGEALAREFIEQLAAMGGGHGDMIFDAEAWIARFVSLQGRTDEAEAMLQKLLARATTLELSANVRSRAHLFHGGNLWRLGELDAAEAEIQTAAGLMSDFPMGTRTVCPDDILLEFISLYTAWGKPERALEYQAMRDQLLANLSPDLN